VGRATGPKGDPGTNGTNGTNGATSVHLRLSALVTLAAGAVQTVTASCLAGEKAVSGGWTLWNGSSQTVQAIDEDRPAQAPTDGAVPTSWEAKLKNISAGSVDVKSIVICAAP
jgi:hypothetical protein